MRLLASLDLTSQPCIDTQRKKRGPARDVAAELAGVSGCGGGEQVTHT